MSLFPDVQASALDYQKYKYTIKVCVCIINTYLYTI